MGQLPPSRKFFDAPPALFSRISGKALLPGTLFVVQKFTVLPQHFFLLPFLPPCARKTTRNLTFCRFFDLVVAERYFTADFSAKRTLGTKTAGREALFPNGRYPLGTFFEFWSIQCPPRHHIAPHFGNSATPLCPAETKIWSLEAIANSNLFDFFWL